jgi:hypothetical protein
MLLSQRPQYAASVLVMHHSWHRKGVLRISKASRGALAQFLEEEDIRIVLSGHVHTPHVKSFRPRPNGPVVHECRCGTTTQIDKMAYGAKTLFGGFPLRPKWPANSLLVHRLARENAALTWQVETLVRTRKGFSSLGSKGAATISL